MNTLESPLRLDNAANIYPASLTKHYSSLFRLRVSFKEEIDRNLLSQALERVSRRFPTSRCRLKAGAFWWYLSPMDTPVEVYGPAPLRPFDFRKYGNHIYRVIADGKDLILDVFHALTDGSGGKTCILTLAAEYCRLKYASRIEYGPYILNPEEPFAGEEIEDSFMRIFAGKKGEFEKDSRAYHIDGCPAGAGLLDTRMVLSLPELKSVCKGYGCTVTEFLTAVLLDSLQYVHSLDRNPRKRNIVKVSVPVDLRPLYGSRSLRNFSTYINIGVDLANKRYSLEALIKEAAARKREGLKKENLEPKIAHNVELEENLMVQYIPLIVKKFIIDSICRSVGDQIISYTLSNLCAVELPEEMAAHISGIEFCLGRQRGTSGAASCISYGDKLCLHMTRKIRDSRLEEHTARIFREHGILCEISESAL